MDNVESFNEFGLNLSDLVNDYKDLLTPVQMAYLMVSSGTTLALTCAPDEISGIKCVLDFVSMGIKEYQNTAS